MRYDDAASSGVETAGSNGGDRNGDGDAHRRITQARRYAVGGEIARRLTACVLAIVMVSSTACSSRRDPERIWETSDPCAPRRIPPNETSEAELKRNGRTYGRDPLNHDYLVDKTFPEQLSDVSTRVLLATVWLAGGFLILGSIAALENISHENGGGDAGYGGEE